jgi:hemerythrin-like domain-containing protein
MKTPTDVLRDEHVLILRGLDLLERAAERAARGDAGREAWWSEMAAWLANFADRAHHAKEEELLFPALLRAGLPAEGGPVQVMLAEHGEGRALVAALASPGLRAEAARIYVGLLRAHIDKENEVLFRLADAVLDEGVQRDLAAAFVAADDARGLDAGLAHAEAALERLAAG